MNDTDTAVTGPSPATPYRPLKLNLDEFLGDLDGEDLTEEQKVEVLSALWEMMRTFVEIGWDVSQLQLFGDQPSENSGPDSVNMLDQKGQLTSPDTGREAAVESESS